MRKISPDRTLCACGCGKPINVQNTTGYRKECRPDLNEYWVIKQRECRKRKALKESDKSG